MPITKTAGADMRRTGHRIAAMALAALLGVTGLGAPAFADAGSSAERAAPSRPAYRVALRADATGTRWTGRETVSFGNRSAEPLREVYIRLWGNGTDGCGTPQAPSPVRISRVTGGAEGASSVRCSAVRIALPAPLPPGGRATVGFDVSITVPDRLHRFGREGDHRYLGNALPVLAVRDSGGWHLDPDVGQGESYYTLASDFQVTLDHPAVLKVPATGVTTTRPGAPGRTVTTSVARQVRDFAWAAGPFRSGVVTSPGGIKVRSYWTAGTPDAWVSAARAEEVSAIDDLGKRFGTLPLRRGRHRSSPTASGSAAWSTPASSSYRTDQHRADPRAGPPVVLRDRRQRRVRVAVAGRVVHRLRHRAALRQHRRIGCENVGWQYDTEKSPTRWATGPPTVPAGSRSSTSTAHACCTTWRRCWAARRWQPAEALRTDHWYGVSTTTAFQRAAQAATPTDLTSFWREHRIRTETAS